ncbi:MAG: folate-binding protein [Actinomycetota bacterium]|nr:folate-binding protein [Actinomycetota bacterium]
MTSPLLSLPGAVPADPPDEGVAAHYGDPLREQRELAAGRGGVDLSHRPVLRVSGPDRLSWLHSLTTQHLTSLAPRAGTTALVLSPHGHVEHAMDLVDDGEAVWMHVEPGTAQPLQEFLAKMRFWSQVEVEDVSADWAVVWQPVADPHPELLSRPRDGDGSFAVGGRDVFVPRDRLEDEVRRDGAPAGVWAHEALRIAAGRPRHLRETDHRTIPHELGWIGEAVHLDKGCYRGQETVARVHNLGRPPRRLVLLHLDGSVETLPTHGAAVELDARPVGRVTSAARHHELGPVALAVVKRGTPTEATLLAGGVAAAQDVLVPS